MSLRRLKSANDANYGAADDVAMGRCLMYFEQGAITKFQPP